MADNFRPLVELPVVESSAIGGMNIKVPAATRSQYLTDEKDNRQPNA